MPGILSTLTDVFTLLFVVSSMLAMGSSLTIKQIITPLRSVRLVISALIVNFVLVPLLVYALVNLFDLALPLKIGFILLSTAAGAPILPKLAQFAKGDIALSIGVMFLLLVTTTLYMPVVLPYLLQGVAIDSWAVGGPLIVRLMIPLAAGLLIKVLYEKGAGRFSSLMNQVSNVGLLLLVTVLLVAYTQSIAGIFASTAGIVAILLFTTGFFLGYLSGGPSTSTRKVLGFATAHRNLAAAFTVAVTNFSQQPGVILVLVMAEIVGLILLIAIAMVFRRVAVKEASGGEDFVDVGSVA